MQTLLIGMLLDCFTVFLHSYNSLRQRRNRRHFDDMFKCFFLNENVLILIKISLKFVAKVQISNIPTLVQIKAWRPPGDKPLSEPMKVSLLTHICVTRPQWINGRLVGNQWLDKQGRNSHRYYDLIMHCCLSRFHWICCQPQFIFRLSNHSWDDTRLCLISHL